MSTCACEGRMWECVCVRACTLTRQEQRCTVHTFPTLLQFIAVSSPPSTPPPVQGLILHRDNDVIVTLHVVFLQSFIKETMSNDWSGSACCALTVRFAGAAATVTVIIAIIGQRKSFEGASHPLIPPPQEQIRGCSARLVSAENKNNPLHKSARLTLEKKKKKSTNI